MSSLLGLVCVLAVGLASRVRPWGAGAYYLGDIFPWWPTSDAYVWDVSLWTNQDGGSPGVFGGSVPAWALRWLALTLGIHASWFDGLTYALPPAIGVAGVARMLSALGVVGPSLTLASAHYAFSLEWVLNSADAAQWSRAMAPWLAWGVVRVNRSVGGPNATRTAFAFAMLAVAFGSAGSVNLPQVVVSAACAVLWLLARTIWDFWNANDRWPWFAQWAWAWLTCALFMTIMGGWLVLWNVFVWILPVLGAGGGTVTAPTSVEAWGTDETVFITLL